MGSISARTTQEKRDNGVVIRPMADGDRRTVRRIVRATFPAVVRGLFAFAGHTLVAERDGVPVGAVVLRLARVRLGERKVPIGVVSWVCVAPHAQGAGIGTQLIRAGIAFLEGQGVSRIYANIHGDNAESARRFAAAGFRPLPAGALWWGYGIHAVRVAALTGHLFDVGYVLWQRPEPEPGKQPRKGGDGVVRTLVAHVPVCFLALVRMTVPGMWDWAMLGRMIVVLWALIVFRHLAQRFASRMLEWRGRYRIWESGFLPAVLTALAAGLVLPVTGAYYPRATAWRYEEHRRELGIVGLAGAWSVIGLTLAGVAAGALWEAPQVLWWVRWVEELGAVFLLANTVLPVFPFLSYDGVRILRYSSVAWTVTAGAALAVAIVAVAGLP